MSIAATMRVGDASAVRAHHRHFQESPRTPSITEGSTVTDGCTKDDEVDSTNLFELQMRFTFAERRIGDLEAELLRANARANEAECRAEQYKDALLSTDPTESSVVRLELEQVKQERNVALILRREAQKEMEEARLEIDKLRNEVDKMSVGSGPLHQDTLKHHESLLHKIGDLMKEKEGLMEDKFVLRSENRKCTNEADFLKHKNENLDAEIEELKMKLALAEREKARIYNDHARLLSARNSGFAALHNPHVQDTRLSAENARLKERIKSLQTRISTIRSNVVSSMTKLDIAWAGWRMFGCKHKNLNNITDGKFSIRSVVDIRDGVFKDMVQDWKNDSQFFQEYQDVRMEVLQHHRAHEKTKHNCGGVLGWSLQQRFEIVDKKRGVNVHYAN